MDLMSLLIRIGADTAQAERGISNVQSGMENTQKKANGFGTKLKKGFAVAGKAALGLSAGVTAVATAAVKLATNAAATTDKIDKMSQKIGISRTAYQELDFVMSQSGASVDSLQVGMKTLRTAMVSATEGGTKQTEMFEALGVAVTDNEGNMRSQEDVFFDTVAALQSVDDETQRAALATELFGKAGIEMVPLLNAGAGSIDEMRQQAHELGLVMDDEAIDAGVHLTDTIEQVKRAFSAIVTQLGVDLMPLIQTALDWVKSHMPEIRQFISDAFTTIKTVIGVVVDFVRDNLIPIFDAIVAFVRDTLYPAIRDNWDNIKNAISTVIAAIVGFWNDTLKPTLQALWTWMVDSLIPALVTAWENLQPKIQAVFDAIAGFWNDTLKPALQAMWTWITETLIPAIQKGWEDLQPKIEAVFSAIAGFWNDTLKPVLTAMWTWITDELLPAIQTAWENIQPIIGAVFNAIAGFWNDTLKPVLESMWTWITDEMLPAVQTAWQNIQPVIEAVFNAISGFWETILKPAFEAIITFIRDTLKPIIENVFTAIKTTINNNLEAIKSLWENTVKPIYEGIVTFFQGVFSGDMQTAWDGISGIVTGVWNGIVTLVETVIENAKAWGKALLGNFGDSLKQKWDAIKGWVTGLWDAIPEAVNGVITSALDWGKNLLDNFKTSVSNAWTSFKDWISGLFTSIPDAITGENGIINSALNWGKDLLDKFKQGIVDKWESFKQWFSDLIPGGIKKLIGFSQPEEGPLSDFDTYGPDMMDLLVQGINDSAHLVLTVLAQLLSNVRNVFKAMGTDAKTNFSEGLNGYWGNELTDAIKNPFESAYNAVNGMNWWQLGQNIRNGITNGIGDLYSWVSGALDFSGVYVRTPHFYVSGWNWIENTPYPQVSVSWYRKAYDNPMLFTKPTVLPTANGLKGFGDGVGGEVVLSESKLREIAGAGGSAVNATFNIYQQPGQDSKALAREIQKQFVAWDNQRKAAFA